MILNMYAKDTKITYPCATNILRIGSIDVTRCHLVSAYGTQGLQPVTWLLHYLHVYSFFVYGHHCRFGCPSALMRVHGPPSKVIIGRSVTGTLKSPRPFGGDEFASPASSIESERVRKVTNFYNLCKYTKALEQRPGERRFSNVRLALLTYCFRLSLQITHHNVRT
ncbi:hypothetical protein GGU11DRAFT_497095 [Lentinula aff. detonsa]|nr:hypothetical protein GGU11DRAFT_497095 [Lentinula aff. detonsa]